MDVFGAHFSVPCSMILFTVESWLLVLDVNKEEISKNKIEQFSDYVHFK